MTMLEQFKPGVAMHFWPGRGASAELLSPNLRLPASVLHPVSSPAFPSATRPASGDGFHPGLAERGQPALEGDRPVIFRPGLAILPAPELAFAGERNPGELAFEVLISLKILDEKSQARFRKRMAARCLHKSPVHAIVHSQSFNYS